MREAGAKAEQGKSHFFQNKITQNPEIKTVKENQTTGLASHLLSRFRPRLHLTRTYAW